MKKTLALSLLFPAFLINAQDTWQPHWQDHGFNGADFYDNVVLGVSNQRAMISTDSGGCFKPLDFPTNGTFVSLTSASNFYVLGYGGDLYKSTDAGVSWTNLPTAGGGTPARGMHWENSNEGVVCAENTVSVTSDGGATFVNAGSGRIDEFISVGTNEYIGIGTDASNVAQIAFYDNTTSGSSQIWSGSSSGIGCLERIDATTIYGFTSTGVRLVSSDNGANFTETTASLSGGGSAGIFKVHFEDANNGVGFGIGDGTIYETTDAGVTWSATETVLENPASSFIFDENGKGFAIGSGEFYRTRDHGQSWNKQATTVYTDFLAGNFKNELIGTACGEGGMVLVTRDGGNNWFRPEFDSEPVYDMYESAWLSDNHGIVVGKNCYITSDGGHSFAQVGPINKRTVIAHNGHYFLKAITGGTQVSSDSGQTWSNNSNIPSGRLATNGTDLFCGKFDELVKSTDNGDTWTSVDTSIGALTDMFFLDANIGFTISATIHRTTDGGATWSEMGAKPLNAANVHFMDKDKGVGFDPNNDQIYYTSDGGTTWADSTHSFGLVKDVFFNSSSTGFAFISNGGGIWSFGDICQFSQAPGGGGGTGVEESENNRDNITLYPNPTFDLIKATGIEVNEVISIYAIDGTLVKQELWQGATDVSDLNRGLYIFHVKGESARTTTFVKH